MMQFESLRRFRKHNLRRSDFVIEVGSGHDPYWRSDLLVDKYITDASERPSGTTPLAVDRPLVVGDALTLPFQSKAADFIIARNVVEHILDIERMMAEMMRVAHRGYITVPSALSEKLFGWDTHFWFISVENGVLTFQGKDRPIYDPQLAQTFHGLFNRSKSFRSFYAANRHLFVTEFWWQGQIPYRIAGRDGERPHEDLKTTQAVVELDLKAVEAVLRQQQGQPGLRQRVEGLGRQLATIHHQRSALAVLNKLACPVCLGPLTCTSATADHASCVACGRNYPVVAGVPLLLPEAATSITAHG